MSTVQLELCRLGAYRADIAQACDEWGEDPYLLAAICLRESGAGYAPGYLPQGRPDGWGDHGFGFGLMQIDRRWHKSFVYSERARAAVNQFRYAAKLLHENREFFRRSHSMSGHDFDACAVAAYNAGAGNVLHAIVMSQPIDSVTTGHDYSGDVLVRATRLRVADPHFFDLAAPPRKNVA